MKKSANSFGLLIFIFSLFIGCKDDPVSPDPSSMNFTFGKVGNKWTYKSTTSTQIRDDITMEVTRSMGNYVYELIWTFPGSESNTIQQFWYINGDKFGLNPDSTGANPGMIMDNKTELNKTYSTVVTEHPFLSPGDTLYFQLLSTNTSATVPAGTFNCLKTKTWSNNTEAMPEVLTYISQNAGIVRQSNQFMLLELISKNF